MGNVLRMDKKRVVEGMIGLGWSDRRIQRETHVHRITIAKHRKAFQNRPQVPAGYSAEKGLNDPQVPTGELLGLVTDIEDPDPNVGSDANSRPLPPPRNAQLIPHLPVIKPD